MKYENVGKWYFAAFENGYYYHIDNRPHKEYANWKKEIVCLKCFDLSKTMKRFFNHKWLVQEGLLEDRQSIVQDFPVRQITICRRKGGIKYNSCYLFLKLYNINYNANYLWNKIS